MNPETHEVIAEPCGHCGADIVGLDYEAVEEDITYSAESSMRASIPSGGRLRLIPCGHYMKPVQFTYVKREGESNRVRQP